MFTPSFTKIFLLITDGEDGIFNNYRSIIQLTFFSTVVKETGFPKSLRTLCDFLYGLNLFSRTFYLREMHRVKTHEA